MDAFKLVLVSLAGWMNREQQHVIEYLQEEIRVLKEQQSPARPSFTDEQRARLARKAKRIRRALRANDQGGVSGADDPGW